MKLFPGCFCEDLPARRCAVLVVRTLPNLGGSRAQHCHLLHLLRAAAFNLSPPPAARGCGAVLSPWWGSGWACQSVVGDSGVPLWAGEDQDAGGQHDLQGWVHGSVTGLPLKKNTHKKKKTITKTQTKKTNKKTQTKNPIKKHKTNKQ